VAECVLKGLLFITLAKLFIKNGAEAIRIRRAISSRRRSGSLSISAGGTASIDGEIGGLPGAIEQSIAREGLAFRSMWPCLTRKCSFANLPRAARAILAQASPPKK